MNVDDTLKERGERYGNFLDKARFIQTIKCVMWNSDGWMRLEDDQKEALETIVTKIGRIIFGDPNYTDSWHDIAGYAKLVEDRLNGDSK